jgi:hypothetical protein
VGELLDGPAQLTFVVNECRMRARVTKGIERALIGALLIAAIAWGFLYNYVLEDKPKPMQLRPIAQFIGGDVGSPIIVGA